MGAVAPSTTPAAPPAREFRLLVARPINTREILTTERTNIGRDDALVRYLRFSQADLPIRPVAVMPNHWILDGLEAEARRRASDTRGNARMDAALHWVSRTQFCLLDGDHRALAAALLDRPVTAVVIETPAHLDELVRSDPSFPHAGVNRDLRLLAQKWITYAYGSVEHATFELDPFSVMKRASLIERGQLLPADAAEVLQEARRPQSVRRERALPCTCLLTPGVTGGAATWREFAERKADCRLHRSRA
jgi:hypothetical protein